MSHGSVRGKTRRRYYSKGHSGSGSLDFTTSASPTPRGRRGVEDHVRAQIVTQNDCRGISGNGTPYYTLATTKKTHSGTGRRADPVHVPIEEDTRLDLSWWNDRGETRRSDDDQTSPLESETHPGITSQKWT